MNYREIGKTGLQVSEICFGPMRCSSVQDGEKALDHAIDSGINVVHSSYEYQTIEQLGSYIAKHPKRHDLHHIIKVNSQIMEKQNLIKLFSAVGLRML